MLRDRVLTAILLLALFLGALFFLPALGWSLFLLIFLATAAWEWAGLARGSRSLRVAFTLCAVLAGSALAWQSGLSHGARAAPSLQVLYGCAVSFWALGAPWWLSRRPANVSSAVLLLIGIVVLVAAYCALVQLRNVHPFAMLLFAGVVWIADVAAYVSGRRFGKRKLAPSISPGKTWAGVYGAFVATGLYALAWTLFAPSYVPASLARAPGAVVWMLVVVALLTLAAVTGDLFESILKRRVGLKDSGSLLPGHGGLLDRIDALLPVLPMAAWVAMQ